MAEVVMPELTEPLLDRVTSMEAFRWKCARECVDFALLASDGTAVAFGSASFGHRIIPTLPDGLTYTNVDVSRTHTVLLVSHGTAVACGSNVCGTV